MTAARREPYKSIVLFMIVLSYVLLLEVVFNFTEPLHIQPLAYKKSLIKDIKWKNGSLFREPSKAGKNNDEGSNFVTPKANMRDVHQSGSVQNIIRKQSEVVHDNQSTGNVPTITVGFFEGFRKFWTYTHLFQPPESPRICDCGDFSAKTTLEKNPRNVGDFDILFVPQDVGFNPLKRSVWDTILSSASSYQKRIYASFEGASKLRFLSSRLPFRNKTFHWSLTHHSKSDFPMPYGMYTKNSSDIISVAKESRTKNWSEGKTSLVAWMSSWTVTSWERVNFVKELKKHLPVDFYGQKYKPCPRESDKCEQTIRRYKFYLALENSCCSEYISEKFWRTLAWDIVPIVVGAPRKDYERLAPRNSFIYADDFDSIEELANYITHLDKNDDEYNEYFRWKTEGKVVVNYPPIKERVVTSHVPPATFFYSCNQICRVGRRYIKEKGNNVASDGVYFDPSFSWWCGSCTKCGNHEWLSQFNI